MSQVIRGVNLGGWLVREKWITPSLFKGTLAQDEWNLYRELGAEAAQRLESHQTSFITEADIAWIADHGLNAVRVPVGYWLFGENPPFVGSLEMLDNLFAWATTHGVQVLIDFHAAPGSQNGWDHSGQAGAISWHRNSDNVAVSLDCIERIAERYGAHKQLLGIELLNEPHWTIPHGILADYYRQGYAVVRKHSSCLVVISDAFRPDAWGSFASDAYENLLLDRHLYQAFDKADKKLSMMRHIKKAKDQWGREVSDLAKEIPLLIGEWSIALDAPAFRGLDDFERDRGLQAYGRVQQQAFADAVGWFYWTYKTEEGGAWSLRDCVARGWLDNNFSIQ